MKKILSFVLIVACISGLIACDSQKTAQEYLKEEKKATERFIRSQGFKIIDDYPENGVFAENEFYRSPEGLYFHVVDSGNGNRAKMFQEIVIRYDKSCYFKSNDTLMFSFPLPDPISYIHGNYYSYGTYGCQGFEIPLNYVGEKALVDMIVPSALGSSSDLNSFTPVYYKGVRYRYY